MKKQINYPGFIPRLFAATVDLLILSVLITPVMNFISKYLFIYNFHDFLTDYAIDTSNNLAMAKAIRMPEFAQYLTTTKIASHAGMLIVLNLIFLAVYFITFWYKWGATPGKMLIRTKIVDADSYERPGLKNLIKRFFGYITIIIGLWSIITNKRKQALHDKIANTVVIKS